MNYDKIKCTLPKIEWVNRNRGKNGEDKLLAIFDRQLAYEDENYEYALGNMVYYDGHKAVHAPYPTESLITNGCELRDNHFGCFSTRVLLEDGADSMYACSLDEIGWVLKDVKLSDKGAVICPVLKFPKDTNFIELFGNNYEHCSSEFFKKVYQEPAYNIPIKIEVWQPSIYEASSYLGYDEITQTLKEKIYRGELKPVKGLSDPLMGNNYYLYKDEFYVIRKPFISKISKEISKGSSRERELTNKFVNSDIVAHRLKKEYFMLQLIKDSETGEEYYAGTSLDLFSNCSYLKREDILEAYKNNFFKIQEVVRKYKETGYVETEDVSLTAQKTTEETPIADIVANFKDLTVTDSQKDALLRVLTDLKRTNDKRYQDEH